MSQPQYAVRDVEKDRQSGSPVFPRTDRIESGADDQHRRFARSALPARKNPQMSEHCATGTGTGNSPSQMCDFGRSGYAGGSGGGQCTGCLSSCRPELPTARRDGSAFSQNALRCDRGSSGWSGSALGRGSLAGRPGGSIARPRRRAAPHRRALRGNGGESV
jgi:hypothetical protein